MPEVFFWPVAADEAGGMMVHGQLGHQDEQFLPFTEDILGKDEHVGQTGAGFPGVLLEKRDIPVWRVRQLGRLALIGLSI